MGTWTNQGFIAQSIEDYKTQIQNIFTTAFGSDFNVTDDTLPQNILIQELAELLANADADSIQVLTQLNPNTVSGIWLDLVAMARGLSRQAGTPQVATVSVVSNPNNLPFTISAGQVFTCNETGEQFTMAQATTISSANASIQVKYSEEGDSTAVVGNHLYTEGVPGIITMEIIGLSAGKERETDADFRTRLKASAPVFNPTIEHITTFILISSGTEKDTSFIVPNGSAMFTVVLPNVGLPGTLFQRIALPTFSFQKVYCSVLLSTFAVGATKNSVQ